ncbi:MAG: phosphoenolpyruvate synthase [Chloroflexi bacterium]|nr:phosphoenolpyruvate synthase [Chloroflexota bacterium]
MPLYPSANTYILPFTSPSANLGTAGGKGANLARLTQAGFAVPPGFIVTTDAYRTFVATNQLHERTLALARQASVGQADRLEDISREIRALFAESPLPAAVADPIIAAYRELAASSPPILSLSKEAVAVRSSATAEDLPGLSFAGQQETYLNVIGEAELLEAVQKCWGSLWTARALSYRARNAIASEDVALAVVVQQMIPAEVSGIVFTANPVTGHRGEIVIDASFGLGEAIVSGLVEPDHYVVRADDGRITTRQLGSKSLTIVPRSGGGTDTVTEQVSDSARQALPDPLIAQLARTAQRVAAHYDSPQDIEWALADQQIVILQSRPITSLYPLPFTAPPTQDLRIVASFNSVQGVTDPFTPLGMDILRQFFGGIRGVFGIQRATQALMPDAAYRLFLDVTDLASTARLRQALLTALNRVDPAAEKIVRQLIAAGRLPLVQTVSRRRALHTLETLRPRIVQALQAARAPEQTRDRTLAVVEQFFSLAQQRAGQAQTLAGLLATIDRDINLAFPNILARLMPLIFPALAWLGLIDRLLVEWLGEPARSGLALQRSLRGNVTSDMNLRLWAAAQQIRSDPASFSTLRDQPVAVLAEMAHNGQLPAVAQDQLARFMAAYGMRAVNEIDIGRSRWREDPAQVLQMLKGYLLLTDPDTAPDVLFERGETEAARTTAGYLARVRRLPRGRLRARLLGGIIRRFRILMALRETPKLYIVRLIDTYRTALLAQAQAMVKRGELAQVEDIFFVPFEDLKRFANGQAVNLQEIAATNRAAYQREQHRKQLPRIILSTGETFYEGLSEAGSADLVGQGVSPGQVSGTVRVVLDPRAANLEPGEILVCPATDPGWTPLFMTAGGLVMEIGGMMTHGSVIAREYGIPAVVGVHHATERLTTGQRVRVDGSAGRITVLGD